MKSQKVTLSITVLVNAPATHVFKCLTDWPAQSQWMVGTVVRATKQQGKYINGEISAFTGIGPFGFTDTMTITTWDPPYQCSVIHTGRIVRGTGDFIVTATSKQQSTFTWSEDFILPLGIFGRLVWPIAKPFITLGFKMSLNRFASWSEKQKAVSGTKKP
jgi:hypothetical protein